MILIYIVHVASTLYMTGLIWFVQVVHYPLMDRVSSERFTIFEKDHQRLTSYVVGPPMLVEALTAIFLVMEPPLGIGHLWGWVGLGLVGLIWLSTAYLQVPEHNKLAEEFEVGSHRRLVFTNWIRTLAWTIRAVWVFWPILAYTTTGDA